MIPRENKNNAYAKFWGTNKEYFGIFRTGLPSRTKIVKVPEVERDIHCFIDYRTFGPIPTMLPI